MRLSVYFVHNRRDEEGGTAPPELQIPEPQVSGLEVATVHAENNHFKSINCKTDVSQRLTVVEDYKNLILSQAGSSDVGTYSAGSPTWSK